MGLFGLFGKKDSKPAEEAACCCEGCGAQGCGNSDPAPGEGAYVKVLGSGAPSATSWKPPQKPPWNSWAWTPQSTT